MKNLLLFMAMLAMVFGALGWVAFNGVGALASNAPPVVVDRGAQPQPLRELPQPPDVEVRSQPVTRSRPFLNRSAARSTSMPAKSRINAARTVVRTVSNAESDKQVGKPKAAAMTPSNIPSKPPAAHFGPKTLPPAEHYIPPAPRETVRRELPIYVHKESDSDAASKAEIEANREWRRRTLERWRLEEARRRSGGSTRIREAKPKEDAPADSKKSKKRKRHRLLFISW